MLILTKLSQKMGKKKKDKRRDADDPDDGVPAAHRPARAKTRTRSPRKNPAPAATAPSPPATAPPAKAATTLPDPKARKMAPRNGPKPTRSKSKVSSENVAPAKLSGAPIVKPVRKSITGTRMSQKDRIALLEKNASIFVAFPANYSPRSADQIESLKDWLSDHIACTKGSGMLRAIPSAFSFVACVYSDTHSRDVALESLRSDTSFRYKGATVTLSIAKFGESSAHSSPALWIVPCGPYDTAEQAGDAVVQLFINDLHAIEDLPNFSVKRLMEKSWETEKFGMYATPPILSYEHNNTNTDPDHPARC
jgi:hypothetical protein